MQLLVRPDAGARAEVLTQRTDQIDLAHIGAGARRARVLGRQVLDVDGAQAGEFELELVGLGGGVGQRGDPADFARDLEGRARAAHRTGQQRELGATVLEAGLVDRDALVDEGLVDLDLGFGLGAVRVVDDDVAGEQLGHAGVVVLDDELLQLDLERQILQHDAAGEVDDRGARHGLLGHVEIGAEGGVRHREPVLGGHVLDETAAGVGGLAQQQHLRLDDQIPVQQAAEADQHDRAVGGDVAELVGGALPGGHHHAVVAHLGLALPAVVGEHLVDAGQRLLARQRQRALALVVEGQQRGFADVFLVVAQIPEDLRGMARNAQAGRDHQEQQDQQEPDRAVDRVQAQTAEHLRPERTELVDVVDGRLVLLDHGADHRGDADDREQRDGKAHRRQQFHGLLLPA